MAAAPAMKEGDADCKVPLITDPDAEITHEVPGDDPTVATLKLTNSEQKKVAFKVKTTDNDIFRIKPVVGILGPGESATITLTCGVLKDKSCPPPKQRYVIFSIYTELNDGKLAWAQVKDFKNCGKRKNLAIKWKTAPPAVTAAAPTSVKATEDKEATSTHAPGTAPATEPAPTTTAKPTTVNLDETQDPATLTAAAAQSETHKDETENKEEE